MMFSPSALGPLSEAKPEVRVLWAKHRGPGEATNAAKRFDRVVVTSGVLFRALSSYGEGFVGCSAREILADLVSRFVTLRDGDPVLSQRAVKNALADLLAKEPNVDLTALTTAQIEWVLQRHLVHEISQEIELDILEKASNPFDVTRRLNEVRDYVEQAVAAAFRRVHTSGKKLDAATASTLASSTIRGTFTVFEEYLSTSSPEFIVRCWVVVLIEGQEGQYFEIQRENSTQENIFVGKDIFHGSHPVFVEFREGKEPWSKSWWYGPMSNNEAYDVGDYLIEEGRAVPVQVGGAEVTPQATMEVRREFSEEFSKHLQEVFGPRAQDFSVDLLGALRLLWDRGRRFGFSGVV